MTPSTLTKNRGTLSPPALFGISSLKLEISGTTAIILSSDLHTYIHTYMYIHTCTCTCTYSRLAIAVIPQSLTTFANGEVKSRVHYTNGCPTILWYKFYLVTINFVLRKCPVNYTDMDYHNYFSPIISQSG